MDILKVRPYGGVGQIGANMAFLEVLDTRIVIDAGILFPHDNSYNISYLIPKYEELPAFDNLIITHGHEDHIGAIIHLLNHFPNITIWAPPFASALIRTKIEPLNIKLKINIYERGQLISIGNTTIYPIQVNHSIPDTYGLLIKPNNKKMSLLYVSDFKIDKYSEYEPPFELERLLELTKDDVLKICFADSTNITSSQLRTTSESVVKKSFDQIFEENPSKRTFVTLFPSNIHRIQSIVDVGIKFNKKVVLYGRSMVDYVELALKTKRIKIPPDMIYKIENLEDVNSNDLVYLLSGSQGEYRGTLNRVVTSKDKYITLNENDLFIYSAKPIPGNDRKVTHLNNLLWEKGCKVIDSNDFQIHASGHAGREDLTELYSNFKPTHVVPIHGETSFLHRHYNFIKQHFADIIPLILYNGNSLKVNGEYKVEVENNTISEMRLIHGNKIEIEKEAISQRRKIAENGVFFITINIVKKSITCEITSSGLPLVIQDDKHDEFKKDLILLIKQNNKLNTDSLKEAIRIFARNYYSKKLGYRPITTIHLI